MPISDTPPADPADSVGATAGDLAAADPTAADLAAVAPGTVSMRLTAEEAARIEAERAAQATGATASEPDDAAEADATARRRGAAPGPYRPRKPRPQERIPFAESRQLEQEWWLRFVLVLVSPRAVFTALRDDRDEAAEARQEPMIALLFLAGLSIFFMSRTAASLYDNADFDAITVLLEAIVTVPLTALQNYWLGGWAVHFGASRAGATGRTRQARHLVGLAQAPLVLALLLVLPVRLAVYGGDMFRSGGADTGVGGHVFDGINLAFVAWAFVLLVLGTRAVWGWSWPRTLLALTLGFVVLGGSVALGVLA